MNCSSVYSVSLSLLWNHKGSQLYSLVLIWSNGRHVFFFLFMTNWSQCIACRVYVARCVIFATLFSFSNVGWARETIILWSHQAHMMHITAIKFIWRQAKDVISRLRLRLPRITNYSVVCLTLWNACRRDIALRGVEVINLTFKFKKK